MLHDETEMCGTCRDKHCEDCLYNTDGKTEITLNSDDEDYEYILEVTTDSDLEELEKIRKPGVAFVWDGRDEDNLDVLNVEPVHQMYCVVLRHVKRRYDAEHEMQLLKASVGSRLFDFVNHNVYRPALSIYHIPKEIFDCIISSIDVMARETGAPDEANLYIFVRAKTKTEKRDDSNAH